MEDFMCNVLIMGKTGTGKSTLLNYICDTKIAETGTGKPVTGEGLYEHVVSINNQDVRLFDSWGIEAGKVDRWKALIADALKAHGTQKSIKDWFHSVIYCVQAGGGRVEDIDVEIIKQFLKEGYKLTVVLTKADQVSETDEAKMKETISYEIGENAGNLSNSLNIIATCAEKKVTRSGETQPFGKEEVCNSILTGWRDSVIERLPKHVIARICEYIREEMAKIKNHALSSKISGLQEENEKIYNQIQRDINELSKRIENDVMPSIMKEVAQSCHKADLSLRAMLNVGTTTVQPNKESHVKPIDWLIVLATMAASAPIVAPILQGVKVLINFLRTRSKGNINEQKKEISDYIDKCTTELIEKCKSQENQVAQQLNNALK